MSDELACVEGMLSGKHVSEGCAGAQFISGTAGKHDIVLVQSGIGKVCAAVRAFELITRYAPGCVINTGVAGGIDARLRVMDMVVASQVVYHDVWCGEGNAYGQVQGLPPRFNSDKAIVDKILSANAGDRVHAGLICSGDKFITDRAELDLIKRNFPEGLAVDMESAAIAQVCYMCATPFVSMRIISDTPGVEGHWQQYTGFWQDAPQHSFAILRRSIQNL